MLIARSLDYAVFMLFFVFVWILAIMEKRTKKLVGMTGYYLYKRLFDANKFLKIESKM